MKTINYNTIQKQIESLTDGEDNLIANLSNAVALLKAELNHLWIGFYIVDSKSNQLVLGPFQGPIACTRIPYGKGVCGESWKQKKTLVVEDVHKFPGHIACSSESNSEIVLPVFNSKDEIVAVLDIDSKNFSEFSEEDRLGLEPICHHLGNFF